MNSPQDAPRGDSSRQATPPSISLPKGGGAIRSIGEKFAANPVTGTGSMTVPIATSPGLSGSEDLVPSLNFDGIRYEDPDNALEQMEVAA